MKIHEKSETIGGTKRARNLTMLPARFEKIVVIFDLSDQKSSGNPAHKNDHTSCSSFCGPKFHLSSFKLPIWGYEWIEEGAKLKILNNSNSMNNEMIEQ